MPLIVSNSEMNCDFRILDSMLKFLQMSAPVNGRQKSLCVSEFSMPQWCGLSSKVHQGETEDTEMAQRRVLSIPSKLLAITFEVSLHFSQTISTKLFAHRSRQHQRHHRLADHTSSRHSCNV